MKDHVWGLKPGLRLVWFEVGDGTGLLFLPGEGVLSPGSASEFLLPLVGRGRRTSRGLAHY
jgi:hypothetical protein